MSKKIDLYRTDQEFTHRHTAPTWMSWMNRTQPQQQHEMHGQTVKFIDSHQDSEELWRVNCGRLPQWWRWHTEPIHYQFNTEGFRNHKDLQHMDWSQSHVIFGSSDVTGHGVPQHETIAHYMQEITGQPCVNMGVDGGSCDVVFNNIVKMVTDHGVPRGVHIIWPSPIRQIDDVQLLVHDNQHTWLREDIGSWNAKPKHMHDSSPFYRRNLYVKTVKIMLKGALYSDCHATAYEFVHGERGNGVDPQTFKLQISTPYPEHVVPDLNKKKLSNWAETSKEWYFNNFLARDIYTEWNGVHNPQPWTHYGRFANRSTAEYFIDSQQML